MSVYPLLPADSDCQGEKEGKEGKEDEGTQGDANADGCETHWIDRSLRLRYEEVIRPATPAPHAPHSRSPQKRLPISVWISCSRQVAWDDDNRAATAANERRSGVVTLCCFT